MFTHMKILIISFSLYPFTVSGHIYFTQEYPVYECYHQNFFLTYVHTLLKLKYNLAELIIYR